jgi:hypothetical protein
LLGERHIVCCAQPHQVRLAVQLEAIEGTPAAGLTKDEQHLVARQQVIAERLVGDRRSGAILS